MDGGDSFALQLQYIRHSFLNDVSKIIPNVDQFGSFNTWAHVAHNLIHWSFLVNNLHKFETEPCNTDTNPDTNPDWSSPGSKSSPLPQSPPPPPSPPSPLSPFLRALYFLTTLLKFWELI